MNDTTYIRYLNIAKNKTYGTSLYAATKLFKRWEINGNLNVFYSDLQGNGVRNSGLNFSFFTGSTITLGKGWTYQFTGSFNSRRVQLQGRQAAFYYHNTTLRKDVNKQLAIGINLANPFMRGTRFRNDMKTAQFMQREDNINYTRGIRLSINYRFGTLQQQKAPRKAKKVINNDDALKN
jgi:hypothetical protein